MSAARAFGPVRIGVVLSTSGAKANVGVAELKAVDLLPRQAGALAIDYVVVDDASNADRTLAKIKSLEADHVDAIIGPATNPAGMTAADAAGALALPTIVQSPNDGAVRGPALRHEWSFKTVPDVTVLANALVDELKREHVVTFGMIAIDDFFDSYGTRWTGSMLVPIPLAGIRYLSTYSVARSTYDLDQPAAAVVRDAPDAALVAGPSAAAARAHASLRRHGFKGLIYHAWPEYGTVNIRAEDFEGARVLVGLAAQPGRQSASEAQEFASTYQARSGSPPSAAASALHDAALLLAKAAPAAAVEATPGTMAFRRKLRDALENIQNVAGMQGVYRLSPSHHSCLGRDSIGVATVDEGRWVYAPLEARPAIAGAAH